MRTHPWLETRAEYLAAHAPVVDQPSILGDVELDHALEGALKCEVDHSRTHVRGTSIPGPKCSVEVVAMIGCRNCGSLLSCEVARVWVEACLQKPGVCFTCKWRIQEAWWWRLI
jgi:hypothetical protein